MIRSGKVIRVIIVEPASSIDAWIGLAGVVVGAVATGGLNGWLARLNARRDSERALDDAIGDLQAATHALIFTVNVAQKGEPGERLAWSQLVLTQAERTVRASEMIRRHTADRALVKAADDWSTAALRLMDPASAGLTREEAIDRADEARARFQALPAYQNAPGRKRRRRKPQVPLQQSRP